MNDVARRLAAVEKAGRLPQALLFTGAGDVELRNAALQLAKRLLCASTERPCETCPSCRKIAAGHHPDVRSLAPEKKDIKVEQVRDLQRWLAIAPNDGERKIGILEETELLPTSAANSLLKTLEEPPPFATLILLARSPDGLLPTLRSRLSLFRFPRAVEATAMKEAPEWEEELKALFKRAGAVSPVEIFRLTERIAKDAPFLPRFFETAEATLAGELTRNQLGARTSLPPRRLESLFDLACRMEYEALQRYGNTALCLDRLLLEWLSPL